MTALALDLPPEMRVSYTRQRRALAIAAALRRVHCSPSTALDLSDEGWTLAARNTGCRPDYLPSTETRAMVVALLEGDG